MDEPWGRRCSVARTLSVISDPWTFIVLREAYFGVRRFEDFQRRLGIARNVLTNRLRQLVDQGIFVRRQYQVRPTRSEYRLSEKGADLYPVFVEMMGWGDRWMAGDEGPPLLLYHRDCGHHIEPQMACAHCGEVITAHAVNYKDGPGAGPATA